MEHLMGNLVASRFTRWVAPVEKSPASYGVDPHFWPVGRCGKLPGIHACLQLETNGSW